MNHDERLIAEIARVWVDGGGDVDGIHWCLDKICAAVAQEIAERSSEEENTDEQT